jgi:hypothetical protein
MTSSSFRPIAFAACLVSAFLLAGCVSEEGNVEASSINLAYDGDQSGNHETAGACDAEGTLTGHGAIADGRVRIQVLDGSGNSRFDQTYTGDFTVPTHDISGASGTWKITGEREGNDLVGDAFKGSYTVTQRC